jgi:hypothetical protein
MLQNDQNLLPVVKARRKRDNDGFSKTLPIKQYIELNFFPICINSLISKQPKAMYVQPHRRNPRPS